MSSLIYCIRKDIIEIIRKKKLLVLILLLCFCTTLVLLTTKFMPVLLQKAMNVSNILSGDTSLSEFMEKFFPNTLKESIGIYSSDIGVFYSILVICMTFNLLPNEIETGKLILPLCAGYNKNTFFLSKQISYGLFCALPIIPFYIAYYFIGSSFLNVNIGLRYVIINASVLMIVELLISCITIALSVIYKHKYIVLMNMVSIVIIAPDILSMFVFGKYFPTHLLSYLYSSSTYYNSLILPLIEAIVILLIFDLIVLKGKFSIDVDDRK